jgi:hypothetical protein
VSWQQRILNRLDLGSHTKIVIDKIGLLSAREFHQFLDQQNISYTTATSLPQLRQAQQDHTELIITTIELPDYLVKKSNVLMFDYRQLPIDIEPGLVQSLSIEDIVALIEYQIMQNQFKKTTQYNVEQVLADAREVQNQKRHSKVVEQLQGLTIQSYQDILHLGKLWGHYLHSCYRTNNQVDHELQQVLDNQNESLILNGGLKNAFYESVANFKTVDKITGFLKKQNDSKFALICFDGMGAGEWQLLKEYLNFPYNENYIFSLIPSMTAISRSAIFYGDWERVYALSSINEDKAFKDNFANQSCFSFREGDLLKSDQLLGIDAVKIVYNVFDDIAHKTILPKKHPSKNLYYKTVWNYLVNSSIKHEIEVLRDNGFNLWLCSDHGCVVAAGSGQLIDKYLIDAYSKRATIINKSQLADFYDVDQYDIPFVKDKTVLLAKNRTCFASKSSLEITHGGITFEELVVPFVEICS